MITIELSRDHSAYQLSINDVDERGCGHGYRIFGPKFTGGGEVLKTVILTDDDKRQIAAYLRVGEQSDD